MTTRVFQSSPLAINTTIALDTAASHHLARVLRAKINDTVTIFNGAGGEYNGTIVAIDKKSVHVVLKTFDPREAESSLDICLLQGISRSEKMDYTLQKSVELGVKKIIPLITERCNIKRDTAHLEKKWQHWQHIIYSASEQCGRNTLPDLQTPQTLTEFLQTSPDFQHAFVLAPTEQQTLKTFSIAKNAKIALLIGPEGGLTEAEIKFAIAKKFQPLRLGPRILRTETAALAAITALQCLAGDMC